MSWFMFLLGGMGKLLKAAFKWLFAETWRMFAVASLILLAATIVQYQRAERWHDRSDRWEAAAYAWEAAWIKQGDSYLAASEAATAAQTLNLERVRQQQEKENASRLDSYNRRVADARRLWEARADRRGGDAGAAAVSALPAAAGGIVEAAPNPAELELALIAIQLDELISWVEATAKIETSPAPQPPRE